MHTPGSRWYFRYGSVYADAKATNRLADMDRDNPQTRPVERDANGRLMAAAPQLLAALRQGLALVDIHLSGATPGVVEFLNAARAALRAVEED